MKALVLAAGVGSRLAPLSDHIAKPALPVLGVPMFWYPIWWANKKLGISDFAINCSHHAESIKNEIRNSPIKDILKVSIKISDETTQLLGSGGALWKLKEWIGNEPLLVLNAEPLIFSDLNKLVSFHLEKKSTLTLQLVPFSEGAHHDGYTDIVSSSDGRIISFGGKKKSGTTFCGAYIIDPELINRLPDGVSDLKKELLLPLLKKSELYGCLENSEIYDMGTVDTFIASQFALLKDVKKIEAIVMLKSRLLSNNILVPMASELQKEQCEGPVIVSGAHQILKSDKVGPYFLGLGSNQSTSADLSNVCIFNDIKIKIK